MEPELSISSPDIHRAKMSQHNENIQVYVRVRPINVLERNKNSLQVLDCPGSKEVVVRERSVNNLTKTFTFDRVFSPTSKQIEVYKAVVAPLLEEVLLGYNCTVFAYGQTGTGKTFTMEGERSGDPNLTWENDPMTGIVPRALSQLFDELRLQNVEFTVRVSLLELYNEELFDLLSPTDDLKLKQLRLFEDSHRKGSVIIQGLEEVTVHNKHEVYHIMERGTEKRKTAATQMNATSSRSHTVFTVTVHIKESNIDGEELIKIGKLHLVDLAGSENIGRSGAVDKRAREAGSINQSLLTLGRVITALVERAPHVPYRESKLTRLLQDSLGGRTKTSIIATVSPASYNLEETLSTLDYAHRAKNIMNRPEINQRLTKKAVMKEFTEEIERLRRDLVATREKNGVYLDKENYEHMTAQIESQGQDLCEKITQNRALQETLDKKEEEIQLLKAQLEETKEDLATANQLLAETRGKVEQVQQKLVQTELERDQQEHLVESHVKTENNLSKEAEILLQTSEETTSHLDKLYRKLDKKKHIEQSNLESGRRFKADLAEQFSAMCSNLETFRLEHATFCGHQRMKMDEFLQNKETQMAALSNLFVNFMQEMKDHVQSSDDLVAEEAGVAKAELNVLKECSNENCKESVKSIEKSKGDVVKYFETLYDKFKEVHQKLESLAQHYAYDMEEQGLMVNMFIAESVEKIVETRKDIEEHLEDKLARHLLLQSEIASHRQMNDKYIENFRADVKVMIGEMEKWIEDACDYEKRAGKQSENVLAHIGHATEKETAFAKRISEIFDIHKGEAELLRSSYQAKKTERSTKRAENMKELTGIIEHAANTAKFMRGASLEGLNLQLSLANNGRDLMMGKIEQRASRNEEFFKKYFASSYAFVENSEQGIKAAVTGVEEAYDSDISYVGDGKKQMEAHCNEFSQWSESTRAKVLRQSGKLGEFWESTYLVDLPSGMTPQKKEYEYPRNLSATSPHEAILERFTSKRREAEKNEIF